MAVDKNNDLDSPHYIEHRKRLRDRYLNLGIDNLQPYEIIELFLTFVIPQKDVKPSAKAAMEKFGSIKGFFDAADEELVKIPFFKNKALTLRRFIKEIALLYQKQQAEQTSISVTRDNLIEYCKNKLRTQQNEEFWLLSLNSKNALIKEEQISKGLINKTTVYPRQVLERAIKNGAHSILLLHNHTNGNPIPSKQDITITKSIDIPAKILNITVYDHWIVADDKFFSLKENNLL